MNFLKSISLLVIIFVIMSCSSNSDNNNPDPQTTLEYQKITNVSYGTESRQIYDIYLPEGRTASTKVMILVHGGGWSSGDKSGMEPI